ncbi:hypothetical protein M514_07030 [Trichuris suis]|uniref:Uncharacterized protein n=1 Tax=Trichuris suis TaxID=68888 RepID=A0A085N8U2_9BILA|nr:hypothetical protein M513_07030 [Trichuris suis]KFD65888.1 hypothetical protein M514_07030 [Trichuris suis]
MTNKQDINTVPRSNDIAVRNFSILKLDSLLMRRVQRLRLTHADVASLSFNIIKNFFCLEQGKPANTKDLRSLYTSVLNADS